MAPLQQSRQMGDKEARTMTLDEALFFLSTCHTDDDDRVGFSIRSWVPGPLDAAGRYQEAWQVVREHLHLRVRPEQYPV